MSSVFVLDQHKRPCQPVHPGQTRRLLKGGQATIYRRFPFAIRLKAVRHQSPSPLRLKCDPGAKTSGIAVVDDHSGQVVWAAELSHRGERIKEQLAKRRALRRSRRQRHTRYRPPRFANRRRQLGWLAPSLQSRLSNILTWTARLCRWSSIGAISVEVVRFDTQALQNPEIEGIAYSQGTLFGNEVRGYLLEKWGRRCSYCAATGCPLQIEHVAPKSRGGSDRVSNLVLSCGPCNVTKGTQAIREFLKDRPALLSRILSQLKTPLRDAAAVNAVRRQLYERLKATGLPVETSSGGRTQYYRMQRGLPKQHWIDAAVTRASTPERLLTTGIRPWLITARGQQCRLMTNVNKHGFPISKPKGLSRVQGFRTGDIVKAVCPAHLKTAGTHIGRVLVRTGVLLISPPDTGG